MIGPDLVESHDCLEVVEGSVSQGVVNTAVTAGEIKIDKNKPYKNLP